jgi:hypothetical protein
MACSVIGTCSSSQCRVPVEFDFVEPIPLRQPFNWKGLDRFNETGRDLAHLPSRLVNTPAAGEPK